MHFAVGVTLAVLASIGTAFAASNERVLGVYVFHRHGDRTAKSWAPVNLTVLGADEVHRSGTYYRSRYISADASNNIEGVSPDVPLLAQLSVSAPEDAVLHNSAAAFVQALYPPNGASETLANGTKVEAPLGGYQYVPVDAVTADVTGKAAESSAWLQGSSNCNNAIVSSNQYFASAEYASTAKDSAAFYKTLLPVINGTFNSSTAIFRNAYTIWDLINVATIHNSSIPADSLLTDETLSRSFDLASRHEWNLAYNASDPVRAISGAVLAGQILNALQSIVNGTAGSPRFNVQFGSYGAFMAFFGLAQLQKDYDNFYGITDYASSMAFEVYTTSTSSKPNTDEIQVRFLYSNGTASDSNLKQFALFGKDSQSWSDFQSGMSKFALTSTDQWCKMCGGTSGQCATTSPDQGDGNAKTSFSHGNGISKPVAGVIGALVTLAVILGLEMLVMVVGGIRLVRKRKANAIDEGSEDGSADKAN